MDKKEKYKLIYSFAKEFLNKIIESDPRLNQKILNEHINDKSKFENLNDANERLMSSLQSRNMMPSVIGFEKNKNKFKEILFNFDPRKIMENYKDDREIFEVFKNSFEIRNAKSKSNLWRIFARGVISGSRFISYFKDKSEFDNFITKFRQNKYTRAALPMLLEKEIDGVGFALACDFLKELGYRDYPKPDVHLIRIFSALGLSESQKPYEVYKSIIEMSECVGDDAYTVDKIFWLISSGRFHLYDIDIGRNRERFIRHAKQRLKS